MAGQDQLSRLVDEMCAVVFTLLRPRGPLQAAFTGAVPSSSSGLGVSRTPVAAAGRRRPQVSAAGLASLMLGMSLALILCGSLTFMIGFILMPWVLGLVMVLHFMGMLSNLSALGRSVLCPASPPSPKSPRKVSDQLFSKLPIM